MLTEPKRLYFNLSKDTDKNLKREIGFIIKNHEFLAEYTIKNEISQSSSNYKYRNDIYEHRKQ